MIQVCSRCGTRWNVRDRQRGWCPRCQGSLHAPSGVPTVQPAGGPPTASLRTASAPPRPPAGFRWIAVRPGPPPPPRPRRRPLGPTPRYHSIPRWGLIDPIALPAAADARAQTKPASATVARTVLIGAAVVLAAAAAVHLVRYLLLLINRTTLLPPFVALGSLLAGVLVSLAAIVAVIGAAVVLTSWLIGRRAAAFAAHGQDDPRPAWVVWAGCLVPFINLVWAPIFVLELAYAERCQARQRGPVALWWIAWVVTYLVCGWAIWTSRATDAQGVADNTVTMIIAYLAGLAVLVLLWRVFDGFVRKPIDRPVHRWVVVAQDRAQDRADEESPATGDHAADDLADDDAAGDSAAEDAEPSRQSVVESRDREPAA
ncbi:MAG: DUF4328 domain-containing protein [Mycobacterium sp.]|nr:DUF4328 domain-containing protein [Mycobacterium sp.]